MFGLKRKAVHPQLHVRWLAEELGCELRQGPGTHGMMYVEFGYVETPVVRTQRDYLVTLHELGHFALGHTQGRPPKENERFYFDNGVLRSEAQAWEWAMNHCMGELTADTKDFMWHECLSSYLRNSMRANGAPSRLGNGNRHHVEFIYDKPDDYFWNIAVRMWN